MEEIRALAGTGGGPEDVRGDIDLAHAQGGTAAELIIRKAGTAMEHREGAQGAMNLLQDIVTELRQLGIEAVGVADADGQGVDARGVHAEAVLQGADFGGGLGSVLSAADPADFRLHGGAVFRGEGHDPGGGFHVFIDGTVACVPHDGGEAEGKGLTQAVQRFAVVQMNRDGNGGLPGGGHHHGTDQGQGRMGKAAFRNLQNDGGTAGLRGPENAPDTFHVGSVESADGIAFGVGLPEEIPHADQGHGLSPSLHKMVGKWLKQPKYHNTNVGVVQEKKRNPIPLTPFPLRRGRGKVRGARSAPCDPRENERDEGLRPTGERRERWTVTRGRTNGAMDCDPQENEGKEGLRPAGERRERGPIAHRR